MAQVSLRNVTKIFPGNVTAVKDVSLGVESKEFLVLLGPSGCGKSTTLRIVAGLEEATEGDVYIGDKLVNNFPPKDRDIAMVFQNYALYPHMNVYNNMAFGIKLRKYPKSEIDKRVREAASILGLEKLLDRKDRNAHRDDLKDRVDKLEQKLDKAIKDKEELMVQVGELKAQVAALTVKIELLLGGGAPAAVQVAPKVQKQLKAVKAPEPPPPAPEPAKRGRKKKDIY